jgi:hypothetical protein
MKEQVPPTTVIGIFDRHCPRRVSLNEQRRFPVTELGAISLIFGTRVETGGYCNL